MVVFRVKENFQQEAEERQRVFPLIKLLDIYQFYLNGMKYNASVQWEIGNSVSLIIRLK